MYLMNLRHNFYKVHPFVKFPQSISAKKLTQTHFHIFFSSKNPKKRLKFPSSEKSLHNSHAKHKIPINFNTSALHVYETQEQEQNNNLSKIKIQKSYYILHIVTSNNHQKEICLSSFLSTACTTAERHKVYNSKR